MDARHTTSIEQTDIEKQSMLGEDIIDLMVMLVSGSIDWYKCGSKDLKPTEYKCNDCGHNGYYEWQPYKIAWATSMYEMDFI